MSGLSCASTTTTTTLTLSLTGVVTIEPEKVWPLALKYPWLLEEFTTDPTVKSAVQTALASVLGANVESVNLKVGSITGSDKDVVLVEYIGSRTFTSGALASDWAGTSITSGDVQVAINAELAAISSLLRAQVLGSELQIAGLSSVTLSLTGVVTIEPDKVWPLALKYPWLLEEFTTDPTVKSAVKAALASIFDVNVASIDFNMNMGSITSAGSANDTKEVVLVAYTSSRSFPYYPSETLAKDWASTAITGGEVQAAINAELAAGSSLLRAKVRKFELQIAGVPEDPEDPPGQTYSNSQTYGFSIKNCQFKIV